MIKYIISRKICKKNAKSIKNLYFDRESSIFNMMDTYNMADTGGLRNEEPLTEEQKKRVINYAVSLGIPEDSIGCSDYFETSYGPGSDILIIGTDVYPLKKRGKNPNSNVSWRGAIAHELIGHREAHLNGSTQSDKLLENVQASIRAARFTPGLEEFERCELLRDAIGRLHKRGAILRSIKHKLNIGRR